MFRFSIRELSIAALAVALGIAWCAEHNRLNAALFRCDALRIQAKEATQEAEHAKGDFVKDFPAWQVADALLHLPEVVGTPAFLVGVKALLDAREAQLEVLK